MRRSQCVCLGAWTSMDGPWGTRPAFEFTSRHILKRAALPVSLNGGLQHRLDGLDTQEQVVAASLAMLRDECRAAKEALSEDTDTTIPIMLPNVHI